MMRNREEKIARAAHIKRNTKGTSNEISLSVLDAARENQAADGSQQAARFPRLGEIALFTLGKERIKHPADESGASGRAHRGATRAHEAREALGAHDLHDRDASPRRVSSAWQLPEKEISRRKTSRRRGKLILASVLALVVVGVLGAGVHAVSQAYQTGQNLKGQLATALGELEDAKTPFDEFSEFIGTIDELPLAYVDAEELEKRYQDHVDGYSDRAARLESLKDSITTIQARLPGVDDSEAANYAFVSIAATLNAADSGKEIAELIREGLYAYEGAQEAWDEVLEADALSRDAASLIEQISVESVQASMEKTSAALDKFNEAYAALDKVGESCSVSMDVFLEYLRYRIAAQQSALASDQAYLDRDKEAVADASRAYDEADANAVALMKKQEKDPTALIEEHYAEKVSKLTQTHDVERYRAADADAFIRDYLGTVGK